MSRRRCKINPLEVAADCIARNSSEDADFVRKYIDSYKGCGTFTKRAFEKGEYLLEYRGELCNREEGEKRLDNYPSSMGSFLFFFQQQGSHYCIDATHESTGLGKYVNDDQRKPNAKMRVVMVNDDPHLALFALCPIDDGEEVKYDYGDPNAFWRKEKVREEIYQCPDGVQMVDGKQKGDSGYHSSEKMTKKIKEGKQRTEGAVRRN